jgi:hypothetical protein
MSFDRKLVQRAHGKRRKASRKKGGISDKYQVNSQLAIHFSFFDVSVEVVMSAVMRFTANCEPLFLRSRFLLSQLYKLVDTLPRETLYRCVSKNDHLL